MKARTRVQIIAGMLAMTSLATAQEPAKHTATSAPQTVKEAAAPKAEQNQVVLHVTGLTKDNQTAVKDALTGLGGQRYVCATCKHEQSTPGPCPSCKTPLKSEQQHVIAGATVTLTSSSIAITPAPNSAVRLSEIEGALSKRMVHIEEDRLQLSGKSVLVLKDGNADNVAAVEKALKDAKLFDEVHAKMEPSRGLEVEVRAGAAAPTRTSVAKAIEASGTKARLSDVIWGDAAKRS
mgnify:CR=1 FL=1